MAETSTSHQLNDSDDVSGLTLNRSPSGSVSSTKPNKAVMLITDRRSIISTSTGVSLTRVFITTVCVLMLMQSVGATRPSLAPWSPRKGCHKVGHRQTIRLPGCDRVDVLLNGCRGQCLSWAVPSSEGAVASPKFRHKVTSYSHCCRMTEHEEVTYLIKCEEGIRELRFPSALKCDCFDCTHHSLK